MAAVDYRRYPEVRRGFIFLWQAR